MHNIFLFPVYLRLTDALHVDRPIIQSAFNIKIVQGGAYDIRVPQIPDKADNTAVPRVQENCKEVGKSFDQHGKDSVGHSFPPGTTAASLCSPLFVSYAEILRLYQQFKDECGAWYFSQDFFLAYVTYSARAARLSAYKLQISDKNNKVWTKVIEGAVESLELCQLSM